MNIRRTAGNRCLQVKGLDHFRHMQELRWAGHEAKRSNTGVLPVGLSRDEHAWVQAQAAAQGLSKGQFIRNLIYKEMDAKATETWTAEKLVAYFRQLARNEMNCYDCKIQLACQYSEFSCDDFLFLLAELGIEATE